MESTTSSSLSSTDSSGRFDSETASYTSSSKKSLRSLDNSQESIENLHDRLTSVGKKKSMPKFSSLIKSPRKLLRRFASAPSIKTDPNRKLYTVKEKEDEAFNRQLAMLEEPPEWDLNAGIGNEDFETPSLTPPPVTTSRATSPSRVGKVAESSKKGFQKLIAIVMEGPTGSASSSEEGGYNKNSHATRSLPDLSMSGGKGFAGSITDSPPQEPRGRGRSPKPVDDRHRGHHHFPHSWRIPPESTLGNMPHIRNSVPPEGFPFGPVESKSREYTVLARVMWKNGEIRFSDQYNRRLIPVGRQDSFVFELWPVAEGEEVEDAQSSLSSTPIFEEPEEMTEEERAAWSNRM